MSSQLLIIFDLDGTLIKSNIDYEGMRIELRRILKSFISTEEFQNITSSYRSILELIEFIEKNDSTGKILQESWEYIEEQELKGYEKAVIEDDVHPTLEKLLELGHTITILTNNSRKLTDFGLEKYRLREYFEYVLTRDEVTNPKPDPEGLLKTIEYFNKDKEETIFIGDSWLDAETAINAGIKFYYLGNDGAPGTRKKLTPSTGLIEKISSILSII